MELPLLELHVDQTYHHLALPTEKNIITHVLYIFKNNISNPILKMNYVLSIVISNQKNYYQVRINIVVSGRKSTFIAIEKIYCYEQNEEHGANTWKCKPKKIVNNKFFFLKKGSSIINIF